MHYIDWNVSCISPHIWWFLTATVSQFRCNIFGMHGELIWVWVKCPFVKHKIKKYICGHTGKDLLFYTTKRLPGSIYSVQYVYWPKRMKRRISGKSLDRYGKNNNRDIHPGHSPHLYLGWFWCWPFCNFCNL